MAGFKSRRTRPDGSRPSVDWDRTHSDREWRDIEAQYLDKDDIVAGMGVILYVGETCRDEVAIEAGKPESKDYFLGKTEIVKAFVKKEN